MKKRIGRGNGRLTVPQKAFVIHCLACFDTPREAAKTLNQEHGISITPQSAERYDPTKRAGAHLAEHWCELFETMRRRFCAQVDAIPAANKAVRVRMLAKAANVYESAGEYRRMAAMLEQIAKEVGNAYTNRRELTGRASGPMRTDYSELSDEQLDARIGELLITTGFAIAGSG